MNDKWFDELYRKPLVSTGRPLEPVPGGVQQIGDPLLDPGRRDAPDLDGKPNALQGQASRHRLKQMRDLAFFNLGCVYEVVKVQQDIVAQFAAEHTHLRFEVRNFEFTHPVLYGLRDWGTLLQAVPQVVMPHLLKWISLQTFADHQRRIWWRAGRRIAQIHDPAAVDAGAVVSPATLMDIHVLLPFGNLGEVELVDQLPHPPRASFVRTPRHGAVPGSLDPHDFWRC